MTKKILVLAVVLGLIAPSFALMGSSGRYFKVSADTWVYQFKPDKNYGDGKGWADITNPTKSVTLPKMFLGFGGSDKKIVLVRFDLSLLDKNKEIKKAEVNLFNDYAGSAAPITVNAKMITSDWDELKVTYRTMPRTEDKVLSTTTLEGAVADRSSGKWYRFDVTDAAKAWQKGETNYGIALIPQGDSGVDFDIVAREYRERISYAPSLKVTY